MGWNVVLGAISAASGTFNAIDEFNANRSLSRDLAEIKRYLKDLDRTLNTIKTQNDVILKKLDELPQTILNIVDQTMADHLLEERYNDIDDIEENFQSLGAWSRVRIRSRQWERFSSSMNYIFDHENRVSRLLDLILVCDLALVITKKRAKKLILDRLDEKNDRINSLVEAVKAEIFNDLNSLEILLNDSRYIDSHNLTRDLDEFSNLSFVKKPNRTRTQSYVDIVVTYYACGSGPARRECTRRTPVNRTRQVPDSNFHNARDRHVNKINNKINHLSTLINQFGKLFAVLTTLQNYRESVEPISEKSVNHEAFSYVSSNHFLITSNNETITIDVIDFSDNKNEESEETAYFEKLNDIFFNQVK